MGRRTRWGLGALVAVALVPLAGCEYLSTGVGDGEAVEASPATISQDEARAQGLRRALSL